MSKKNISSLIFLLLGVISIIIYFSSEGNLHLDLSKTKFVVGNVSSARSLRVEKRGYRWISTNDYFRFRLHNSNQNFTIDRSNEGTSDLEQKIRLNDVLKVYYEENNSDFNTNVFQVEKENGIIIEPYIQYQKREASRLGIVLLFGIFSIIASVFFYTKTNVIDFLNYFVEGRKKD